MELRRLEEEVAYLRDQNQLLNDKNISLQNQLDAVQRLVFGKKSERRVKEDPNQLKMDFCEGTSVEQLVEDVKRVIATAKAKPTTPTPKMQPVRKPIADSILRVEDEPYEPENLPQGATKIGEERTEILEYKPASLYVRVIIRPKYALPDGGVIIAEMPNLAFPKSNAGASLISAILTHKYVDHLPLYRQQEQFKRDGYQVASSTIHNWVENGVEKLRPLYNALLNELQGSDYLQVDETRMPYLKADKPGAAVKGYMWALSSPKSGVTAFHWDGGSRARKVVVDLLGGFQGALQSDGYGAYDIYENVKGITLLGCWAHARRKFFEAEKEHPLYASQALMMIGVLYDVERQADQQGLLPPDRQKLRERLAFPVIRKFQDWILEVYPKVLPKSKLGKAILYTGNIYPRLARYIIDGNYRIDNNGIENAIRPVALGRKNYLYCGNDASAERTAIIYSLVSTCKKCGVNPREYLTHVLPLVEVTKPSQYHTLLPHNWEK